MKFFFIVPLITHYRETFYQKLISSNPQHEWLIIDGEKKIDDGRPNYYKQFNFPHKRFKETSRKIGPFSLHDYVGLLKFVKSEKPDVVFVPAIAGTKAYRNIAGLARRKALRLAIWSCLWEHPDVKKSLLRGVKNLILKKFLNSASYHLAYSSYAKQRLIEFGYPEKQIFIAYNGIELDGLEASRMDEKRRAEMKKNLGIENDKKILLFVGGLGADKNVKLLLRAAALLKESNPQQPFIMLIVGEGPQQKMLKDFVVANELKNEVKFLGRIVDGVDNYFQCCNCLVLPGAGGLSLTQAMYWEKPCIVAHADGTEEDLVKEGSTGFRFEPDNAQSLKKALLRFMNSSEDELLQMGKNGNTLIMQQSNVDKMLETFNKVISLLK